MKVIDLDAALKKIPLADGNWWGKNIEKRRVSQLQQLKRVLFCRRNRADWAESRKGDRPNDCLNYFVQPMLICNDRLRIKACYNYYQIALRVYGSPNVQGYLWFSSILCLSSVVKCEHFVPEEFPKADFKRHRLI
jgi:hypothetical protein